MPHKPVQLSVDTLYPLQTVLASTAMPDSTADDNYIDFIPVSKITAQGTYASVIINSYNWSCDLPGCKQARITAVCGNDYPCMHRIRHGLFIDTIRIFMSSIPL